VDESAEFEAFAALLRRGRDAPTMLRHLAERLETALPDQVEVRRGGLRRSLRELVVRFEPEQLRIEIRGHRVAPKIDHVVRGVCVRTVDVDVDRWLDTLARALAHEATKSTELRLALEEALR
jgi:hypothetical protein